MGIANFASSGVWPGLVSLTVLPNVKKLVAFTHESQNAADVTGVLWNGDEAFTFKDTIGGGFPSAHVTWWELDNPTPGTFVVSTEGSDSYTGLSVYALTDVANSNAYNEVYSATESPVSVTVVSNASLVISAHTLGRADTVTQSIASPWNTDASATITGPSGTYTGRLGAAHRITTTAGSVTADWDLVGAPNRYAQIVVAYPLLTTVRPASDVTDALWLNEAGNNTNLYDSVDDIPANNVTYIESPLTVTPDAVVVALGDPGGVPPAGDMTLNIRLRKV